MAIGAQEAQILGAVIMVQAVDVVDLQQQRPAVPLRVEPTLLAAMAAT